MGGGAEHKSNAKTIEIYVESEVMEVPECNSDNPGK